MRTARALLLYWSSSLQAEMEYRANFLIASLASLLTLAGSVLGVSLFYQGGYELGGWRWTQALMILGVYTLLDGIQATLFTPNHMRLTESVRTGALDFVLLKPIDSQLAVSLRAASIWGLPGVLLGVGLLGYAGLAESVGWRGYLAGLVPMAIGLTILYALGFILATTTIWFVKVFNITIAMQALLEAGRYPVTAYPPSYRAFFTFVVPVAFMTMVPAQAMLGLAEPVMLVLSLAVAGGTLAISRWFWFFALRFYTSASS